MRAFALQNFVSPGGSIDHLRPAGRLRDESGIWSTAAQLEPDKTGFWLPVPEGFSDGAGGPSEDAGVIIAVEIKPKGSGMPVGALVPEGPNRLKYRVHRFDAQQRFKAQTKQSWGMIRRSTGYHPTELFSGDSARASETLKELLVTPQNKFRAWENGRMLFGAGSGRSGPEGHAIGTKLLDEAVVRAGLDNHMGCVRYVCAYLRVSACFCACCLGSNHWGVPRMSLE